MDEFIEQARPAVLLALQEDIGDGDATSLATIPPDQQANGRFPAKASGVIAGLDIVELTYRLLQEEQVAQHEIGNAQNALPNGLVGWHGRCEVHDKFSVQDIDNVRTQYADVMILSHPECSPEVVGASDFTGSTSAMIRFLEETDAPRYLLLTECSMGDNIIGANPDKEVLRLCSVRCPHMGQITMEDTLAALEKMQYEITVPEEIMVKAARSVQRMVEIV